MKKILALISVACCSASFAQESLTVWMTDARPGYKKWLDNQAQIYQKANPKTKVNVVHMAPNDAYIKIPSAAAANAFPDLIWSAFGLAPWIHEMAGAGLAPVDDVIDKLGRDRFDSDSLAQWRYQGKTLCVPVARTPTYLIYRSDLLAKAGIAPPAQWSDVVAAAKKLNNPAEGFYGIAIPGKTDFSPRFAYGAFLYSMGGRAFDSKGNPTFDSKESIEALALYKELYKYAPPGSLAAGFSEIQRSLGQGKAAMTISNASSLATFLRTNKDLGEVIALALPGKEKVTIQNQRGWCVKEGPSKAAAKAFLTQLFTTSSYTEYMNASSISSFPIYKDAAAFGVFSKENDVAKAYPKALAFLAQHTQGRMVGIDDYGLNAKSGELISSGMLEQAVNLMLARDLAPADVARELQKKAKATLGL